MKIEESVPNKVCLGAIVQGECFRLPGLSPLFIRGGGFINSQGNGEIKFMNLASGFDDSLLSSTMVIPVKAHVEIDTDVEGIVRQCDQVKISVRCASRGRRNYENMNQNQKSEYLKSGAIKCPFCGDYELDSSELSLAESEDEFESEVQCTGCGRKWVDIYRVVDVRNP